MWLLCGEVSVWAALTAKALGNQANGFCVVIQFIKLSALHTHLFCVMETAAFVKTVLEELFSDGASQSCANLRLAV